MTDLGFSGRSVAIGGVSSSIGNALAVEFLEVGARVHGADRSNANLANGILFQQLDLVDVAQVKDWIAAIGPVDILINNAGGVAGQEPVSIENLDDDAWQSVIDANLTTTRNLCRAVVPGMKQKGSGVIINIGSGAAQQASLTGIQAYCASKHAVLGLTRQLALELGPFGIRVNCVAPGFIIGPSTQRQWEKMGTQKQEQLVQSIPLRRLGTPQDIAKAVLLMASDYAGFISGQILSVSGGR